ncbi:MAG: glycosyltransferase [Limisphaerales bacterium]
MDPPPIRPFDVKLGLVIPAFNAEPWIGETLRSVLDSDFPAPLLDIVVIDDGSTDGTVREAKQVLRNSAVSWQVHSCERGGPGRARNLGAGLVAGEWIQFLDADDLLAKTKLAHQIRVARKADREVAVVFSPWASLSAENGSLGALRTPEVGEDPVFELLATRNFIALGSQLVNRSWFERTGGFIENHWLIEDVEMALRIAMAGGKFVGAASGEPMFYYRRHPCSLSRQNAAGFAEGCVRNARMAERLLKERGWRMTGERKRVLLDVYGHALRVFYERDRVRFEELLRQVEELEPGYSPDAPTRLKWLSRVIGYRRAEATALAFRRGRGWAGVMRLNTRFRA